MDLIIGVIGIVIAVVIGLWQIWLARKQVSQNTLTTKHVQEVEQESIDKLIQWDRSANLFWLGHDLASLYYVLRSNSTKDECSFYAYQALHHLSELGFDDIANVSIGSKLRVILDTIVNSDVERFTRSTRNTLSVDVEGLITSVGALAETRQTDFVAYHSESKPFLSAHLPRQK